MFNECYLRYTITCQSVIMYASVKITYIIFNFLNIFYSALSHMGYLNVGTFSN